ncbi:MAG: 50S ribosomal protein L22 [Parcubacteria group bacterium GW2011_GWA2_38_13]|nr:MAG: 50S ribosomal protein L22 [Parcubacteria group bacterium GW2011_GWA2_38_13]
MEEKNLQNTVKGKAKEKENASPKTKTQIRAILKFLRMGPRKVRLITNFVNGMSVTEALTQLQFLQKNAKDPIKKLIESAVANAKHNFGIEKKDLFIEKFIVNQGPTLKRWKPKAYGRAGMIRKRTCHVELTLGSHVAASKLEKKSQDHVKKDEIKILTPEEMKKESKSEKGKDNDDGKKSNAKGFTKRLFSRKTG